MKQLVIVVSLCVFILFFSSCKPMDFGNTSVYIKEHSDLMLYHNINSFAVVGVRFDSTIENTSVSDFEMYSMIPGMDVVHGMKRNLSSAKAMLQRQRKISDFEKNFYRQYESDFYHIIDTQFQGLMRPSADVNELLSTEFSPVSDEKRSQYYMPNGLIFPDIYERSEHNDAIDDVRMLCDLLAVDALVTVDVAFYTIVKKRFFIFPHKKFGSTMKIIIRNRDGKLIAVSTLKSMSKTYKVNDFRRSLTINNKNKHMFLEAKTVMLQKLKSLLRLYDNT
ncbi:hypothetical protein DID76_02485 [Candidatus Marinamargulisbacteria bacterium SCGC AG-414-C22]|nr:hypothetical protein DID76_02485 [Candidatus Marinamargulisbacteria bacterium SCGC AG-414-C22]